MNIRVYASNKLYITPFSLHTFYPSTLIVASLAFLLEYTGDGEDAQFWELQQILTEQ
jgi:hypothetical protein